MIPLGNNTTLWLHLAGWNLTDFQLSCKSKMELSVAINPLKDKIHIYVYSLTLHSMGTWEWGEGTYF